MADLSPAAQAVKDAVLALYSDEKVHKFGWQLDAPTVAAALRAAANQVVPDKCPPIEDFNEFDQGYAVAHLTHRQALLAIADELDNNATH
jgi:hypothetical protein